MRTLLKRSRNRDEDQAATTLRTHLRGSIEWISNRMDETNDLDQP